MVKAVRTSKSAVPVGAFSSFKDVEERWVKTTMLEGDPIVDKKLGPKGSPPGLVANIPVGMRAYAVEVNEQSGVSGFHPSRSSRGRGAFRGNDKSQMQRGETILQNIQVLAAGQVFTRPEEKSLLNRTVTLAVFPDQVDVLVAARAKGPLSLSLRGVNDHDIVNRPKPKPEISEEEKARRAKLEKELEELKLALAKKMAEPPPASALHRLPSRRNPSPRRCATSTSTGRSRTRDLVSIPSGSPSTKRPGRSPSQKRQTLTTMNPALSASEPRRLPRSTPVARIHCVRDH